MGDVVSFDGGTIKQSILSSVLIPATYRTGGKDYILIFELSKPDVKQEKLYLKNFKKRFKAEGDEIEVIVDQNNEVNKKLIEQLLVNIRGFKGTPEKASLLKFIIDRPDLLSMVLARLFTNFTIVVEAPQEGEDLVLEALDSTQPQVIKGVSSIYSEEEGKVIEVDVVYELQTPSDIDRLGYISRSAAVINSKIGSWGKPEDIDFAEKTFDKLLEKPQSTDVPLFHKVQVIEALFNTVSLKNA